MPLRSVVLVFGFLLVLNGAVLAQPDRFEQIGKWASQGRFKEAAGELRRIVRGAEPDWQPSLAERKLLRRAIESARQGLQGREGKAARQLLCMSRAYFSEELPGIERALRVVGHPQRPELIGKPVQPYPEMARKAGIRGTVIVEVVIDREGCVRRPRVLKGLPLGLNEAALAAVRSWTFQPATMDGRPVAVHYVLAVSFPAKE
jgi:TonB family protein